MAINLDKALGIHPHALSLRAQRAEVIASNLANADTPGYKARDIDFRAVLSQANVQRAELPLAATHAGHIKPSGGSGVETLYRQPFQASLDGNTVEAHVEQAKFMENALQYQASLEFLGGRIRGLLTALKGE